jgi:hypothetical protein
MWRNGKLVRLRKPCQLQLPERFDTFFLDLVKLSEICAT